MTWFKRGKHRRGKEGKAVIVAGDPEGVARAESQLQQTASSLQRDRKEVIVPLRNEAYRNNIQDLVERLLRQGRDGREPGTNPH